MAARYRQYAKTREVLFAADWGVQHEYEAGGHFAGNDGGIMGADAILWLCGQEALLWPYDQPVFFGELLHMLGVWNRKRMEIVLDTGVDMIVKRAWYENAPFYSPPVYRQFMVPELREETALAHQAGAKFAYQTTTGLAPYVDAMVEAGVDIIQGVDPAPAGCNALADIAQRSTGRIAIEGGLSYPLHMEGGTPEGIRQAVERAIGTLGRNGGFILGVVGGDCIRPGDPGYPPPEDYYENRDRNARAIIEAWRELRCV